MKVRIVSKVTYTEFRDVEMTAEQFAELQSKEREEIIRIVSEDIGTVRESILERVEPAEFGVMG